MRLEGSLDAFSLPDIFALLSMTKKTGGLHLRRSQAEGVVWFTTGALTGGASDVNRQSLARRVVGSGQVDLAAVEAAVRTAASESAGVTTVLQREAAVDEALLHDLVGEHIVDTVFDLLRWPDGDFEFVVDEANPDDVGVSRQVDDVVTEARRRLEAWSGVATTIPSPASVLCVRTTLDADPELTRDEWSLLALVDGTRSVAEIVAVAGRGEFAVVSALAQLVERGLLRISETTDKHPLVAAQEMLSTLETGAAPAVIVEEVALEPAAEPMASGVDVIGDTEPVPAPEPVAETTAEPESEPEAAPVRAVPPLAAVPDAPDRSVVTPARAEPFLPRRQPDHPEEPVPAVAAAMGGAMAAPAAATYIERDPSVNKSLLLRLIAGVRGL